MLTLIDFNVAVDMRNVADGLIEGGTGLKEWSAPETRSKANYEINSDMWSVGCLLYFMNSGGVNPFTNTAYSEETIHQCLNDLSGKVDNDNLIDLIAKLLQLDPKRRISATEAKSHPFFEDFNRDV